MMKTENPTPETDRFYSLVENSGPERISWDEWVLAKEHARSLERRLNEAVRVARMMAKQVSAQPGKKERGV